MLRGAISEATRSLAALLPMRRHAMAPISLAPWVLLLVARPACRADPADYVQDGHEQDSYVPESAKPRRVHGRGHLH